MGTRKMVCFRSPLNLKHCGDITWPVSAQLPHNLAFVDIIISLLYLLVSLQLPGGRELSTCVGYKPPVCLPSSVPGHGLPPTRAPVTSYIL